MAKRTLLTPAQAHRWLKREEAKRAAEERREFEPLHPDSARQLRQLVKLHGKSKILRFVQGMP